MTYKQLNKEQREVIQLLINKKENFTTIGNSIKVDRTTISKEIKRNRYIKSNYYDTFDFKGISKAVNDCKILQHPPYVCNTCPLKSICCKHKLFYDASIAHEHYEQLKTYSRSGIDITPEVIEEIENSIVPLIKDKHQSINQIYANHDDLIYFSKPTFYKYIDMGVFSLSNLDLPKKVKYKKRKRKYNKERRELSLLKGRSYEDFCLFTMNHPKMHIYEMDTVIGKRDDQKALLTIYFKDTHFMLIRLLDKKTVACVNEEFKNFKSILGIKLYAKIFRIGLTDNGSEFFDPYQIEKDYDTGKRIANLFYCNPNRPDQKGGIEKNHEYIRLLYPKGSSFNNLTKEDVILLENTINNIPRDSLHGLSPYQATKDKYPSFISKLSYISYIQPDDIDLSPKKDINQ